MIIKNSSIGMDSARTYTSVSRDAKKGVNVGNIRSFFVPMEAATRKGNSEEVQSKESGEKSKSKDTDINSEKDFDDIFGKMRTYRSKVTFSDKLERDAMQKIRVQCIQYLINLLFGRTTSSEEDYVQENVQEKASKSTSGFAGAVSSFRYYSETEETSFSASGKVLCADGREIDFNLQLTMSRSFSEYYEDNFGAGGVQFIDPLVINLDSPVADVSDVKVKFDLDADGIEEEMNLLSKSSGYLSLDRNGDGVIGDGSELFGTASGDGFAELSEYDLDGNGWIDEADEIFDKLTICFFNEDGTQEICKLKDKGIGALCLANSRTEFSVNDLRTNDTNARIRSTGIFLYENGGMGTIQNLDLAQ